MFLNDWRRMLMIMCMDQLIIGPWNHTSSHSPDIKILAIAWYLASSVLGGSKEKMDTLLFGYFTFLAQWQNLELYCISIKVRFEINIIHCNRSFINEKGENTIFFSEYLKIYIFLPNFFVVHIYWLSYEKSCFGIKTKYYNYYNLI